MSRTIQAASAVVISAVWLSVGIAAPSAASTVVTFDASPGTGAPPAMLGPYAMTAFSADPQPVGTAVSGVTDPAGDISFSPMLGHYRIGAGWATWSHGYTGDVYTSGPGSVTIGLPTGADAFYLYAEPNPFAVINITATTDDGTTSGAIPVNGLGGARYFGFYSDGSVSINSITVSSSEGFAIGEFGINTICNPDISHECKTAGYQASGRDFRYVQALIRVPGHSGDVASDPAMYVALDDSAATGYNYVRVGVRPCSPAACPAGNTSGWEAFVMIVAPGRPAYDTNTAIASAPMGAGVLVSAYFNRTGNSVHTRVQSADGSVFTNSFAVNGPTYSRALAVADWSGATAAPRPAIPAAKTRDTQFQQGAITTLGGQHGTFAGPWTLTKLAVTSNGDHPPLGTLVAGPSSLWTDGMGRGPDDAFGVWRFPF